MGQALGSPQDRTQTVPSGAVWADRAWPTGLCGPARSAAVLHVGSEFAQGTPQDQDPRELLPVSVVM